MREKTIWWFQSFQTKWIREVFSLSQDLKKFIRSIYLLLKLLHVMSMQCFMMFFVTWEWQIFKLYYQISSGIIALLQRETLAQGKFPEILKIAREESVKLFSLIKANMINYCILSNFCEKITCSILKCVVVL